MYCPCQVFRAIFTVFVDVCLEKKEGILGGEGFYCLPSGSHQDEGVGKVNLVYVGEWLSMGGDSSPRLVLARLVAICQVWSAVNDRE